MRKLFLTFAVLFPALTYALGLGNINVRAYLNQPFLADIKIIAAQDIPTEDIHVRLADEKDFNRLGLKYTFVLSKLTFKVIRNRDGVPIIRVSSRERITEPYLKFLLDVTWRNGQFFRVYTVLLDPPDYAINVQPRRSARHHERANEVSPRLLEAVNKSKPRVNKQIAHSPVRPTVYGPIKPSENLWHIAHKLRPDASVTLPQMMIAIIRRNPRAFIGNNINQLKAGYMLRVPSVVEIEGVSVPGSDQEVAKQNRRWYEKNSHPITPQAKPSIIHEPISSMVPRPDTLRPHPVKVAAKHEQLFPIPSVSPSIHIVENYIPAGLLSDDLAPIAQPTIAPANIEFSPLLQDENGNATEIEKTLKAELAVSAAAANSATQSNLLLQQQITKLQSQNEALQQMMTRKDQQIDKLMEQVSKIIANQQNIASQPKVQGTRVASNVGELGHQVVPIVENQDDLNSNAGWGFRIMLAVMVLLLGSSAVAAYWYFIQNRQRLTRKSRINEFFRAPPQRSDESELHQRIREKTTLSPPRPDVDIHPEPVTVSPVQIVEAVTEPEIAKPERILPDVTETVAVEEEKHVTAPLEKENAPNEDVDVESSTNELEFESGLADGLSLGGKAVPDPDELPAKENQAIPAATETEGLSLASQTTSESEIPAETKTKESTQVIDVVTTTTPSEIPEGQSSSGNNNDFEQFAGDDVTATKLDLAMAYINMEDQDSAREILMEILNEGNEAQKQEAQKLLDQL